MSQFTALALFCGRIIESVEGLPNLVEAKKAARELRHSLLGRADHANNYLSFAVRKPNGLLVTNLADVNRFTCRFSIQADPTRSLYRPIA